MATFTSEFLKQGEKMENSRREFFRLGALGAVGLAVGSTLGAVECKKSYGVLNFDRSKQKALLLSSSGYKDTGFLNHALEWFAEFINANDLKGKKIAFVPYASVRRSYDDLEARVKKLIEPLGVEIIGVHQGVSAKDVVAHTDGILVSGGNTFKLVHDLYENELMELIAKRVSEGIPYIGWSAGSNVAGTTMMTTNDMPIIEPASFNTLNIFPHQINPHFISGKPKGHNGESREERLEEYLILNQSSIVYALPEGVALLIDGKKAKVLGKRKNVPMLKMAYNKPIEKIEVGSVFEY